MKRFELPWRDWIELALDEQSPGRLHTQIPESLYPIVQQPTEGEIRRALTFLIHQSPREKMWGSKYPEYERGEWINPDLGDYSSDEYEWAFYEGVNRHAALHQLQCDHLVSLLEAHVSGGCNWSQQKKWSFFADKSNIFLTTPRFNRAKEYHDPVLWRPPRIQAWPRYAETWIKVKGKWGLTFDPAEIAFLRWMLITPVQ